MYGVSAFTVLKFPGQQVQALQEQDQGQGKDYGSHNGLVTPCFNLIYGVLVRNRRIVVLILGLGRIIQFFLMFSVIGREGAGYRALREESPGGFEVKECVYSPLSELWP
jgi:hypothetical protein